MIDRIRYWVGQFADRRWTWTVAGLIDGKFCYVMGNAAHCMSHLARWKPMNPVAGVWRRALSNRELNVLKKKHEGALK